MASWGGGGAKMRINVEIHDVDGKRRKTSKQGNVTDKD